MLAALPSGVVVGTATFVCYLLAYRGRQANPVQQAQASTSALITLLIIALWVLAVVARPYTWWRVALIMASFVGYSLILSTPLTQQKFMLDPTNLSLTAAALAPLGWRSGRGSVVATGRRGAAATPAMGRQA
jgi:cation-transporting ATPase E